MFDKLNKKCRNINHETAPSQYHYEPRILDALHHRCNDHSYKFGHRESRTFQVFREISQLRFRGTDQSKKNTQHQRTPARNLWFVRNHQDDLRGHHLAGHHGYFVFQLALAAML